MRLSENIVTIIGIAFAIVGFALLLAVVGLNFLGITFPFGGVVGELIAGILFLAAGIYIIRGGTVSL